MMIVNVVKVSAVNQTDGWLAGESAVEVTAEGYIGDHRVMVVFPIGVSDMPQIYQPLVVTVEPKYADLGGLA